MDNTKGNRYYLEKIIADLKFIIKNTHGFTKEQLENNEILVDSIMFRLIQISENSDKLTEDFKTERSFIAWRAIKGMRNRIVHQYGSVDMSVVFDTVKTDIPALLENLEKL